MDLERVETKELTPIREMIQTCIQCGTCSGSCPNTFAMDHTPRRMWKMVMSGEVEAIFRSKTFMLCSSCYLCTLRCPRGLPLTEAMGLLKQIAARNNCFEHKRSIQFYNSFMESVSRHGRVRETEMMMLYFLAMKNPIMPFKFAPLAMKLFLRGKIVPEFPSRGKQELKGIFEKAKELEDRV
jgi:heterodisulfide reductase subunit C